MKRTKNKDPRSRIMHVNNSVFTDVLTSDNDHFNLCPTCDKIESYIAKTYTGERTSYRDNTIALIGEWGSGKSTVFYNLYRRFGKDTNFLPIYFNAWEYQNDVSFSYSIITKLYKNYFKPEHRFLIGFLSSAKFITSNSSFSISIGDSVGISNPTLAESLKNKFLKSQYYDELLKFKKNYNLVIDKITKNKYEKGIIVFIDDLDRCDADKVMDLLSDLRRILSYSKDSFDSPLGNPNNLLKIIFILAVDKTALSHAIRTKYGSLFEPNQYLEKIIDRRFIMQPPKINQFFLQSYFNDNNTNISDTILSFLHKIEYTNPRKVKNLFNHLLTHGIIEEHQDNYMKFIFILYLYILKNECDEAYINTLNPISKFATIADLTSTERDNTASSVFRRIMQLYGTGHILIEYETLKHPHTLDKVRIMV